MSVTDLAVIAQQMVARGRGVLAADESNATIAKRFAALDIPCDEASRAAYRDTLLSTPGLEEYISGVILYEETLRQVAAGEVRFPKGVLIGVKVDTGSKPLANDNDEQVTEGLDGLRERIAEFVALGAKFAKWRAVIIIDEAKGYPTDYALHCNAHALARYAALCQEGGLVPIVEPEVLMDGENDIETCFDVTERAQRRVFQELARQQVALEAMVLKPNMVISGKLCPVQASPKEVAERTLECLYRTVPAAVPGIAFLSGGQSAAFATEHLDLMVRKGPHPWTLTFSYGRALQNKALRTWGGSPDNVAEAQKAASHRAALTSAAATGSYSRDMETVGV